MTIIMVYMLLVDGFEEIEALTPVDILRRCGIEIKTAGVFSKRVTGAHNISVEADILIGDINEDDMDALILPGGPGHVHIEESESAMKLIEFAAKNDKYIAAICAAPSILGKLGLLKGRSAVCFPCYEKHLHGAYIADCKTVIDGKFITAKGAGAASEFGFAIAACLSGQQTADKIKAEMQY